MIDSDTLKRDARANILDWPVKARYKGRPLTVGLQAVEDVESLMSGGILDDMALSVLAIADDFNVTPKRFDSFEIQLADGTWKRLEIRNVPDRLDPLGPTFTIYLQSPHK